MNFNFPASIGMFYLLPVLYIAVVVYFVLRFLRAIERGVAAHERIAQHLTHSNVTGPGSIQ